MLISANIFDKVCTILLSIFIILLSILLFFLNMETFEILILVFFTLLQMRAWFY